MINIIVLLSIKNSSCYEEFEEKAVKIMHNYGGNLVYAFEPDYEQSTNTRYNEIHCLEFPDIESFNLYRSDPKLIKMAKLRERAISHTEVIVSRKYKYYINS